MDRYFSRALALWRDLSPVRKGLLTVSGIGTLVLVFVLVNWSSRTAFVPLYSNLDSSDSGRIIEDLRAQGVPFELEADGTRVLVPEANVDELRVGFASQGLPVGGHVGFEIFQGNSLTATDFVQKLNFQRGLEGEIARTIESFPTVEGARVHIVMPERSLFRDDQRATTASVVLKQRPGAGLAQSEVTGIAHLVAGAVEGLEKASITILDSGGTILYDGAQVETEGAFGGTAHQLDLQRTFDRTLERDVQQTLDRALGPAKALVSVRAVLNFDRIETQTETYQRGAADESGVPRSQVSVTESYTTNGATVVGAVPGAVANVPGANADLPAAVTAATGTDGTAYQRTETTNNFEVGKTVTTNVGSVGDVQRLSVSVLLDESVTAEQATALEASVGAAVGLDPTRGDTIVVSRVAFDRTALDAATAAFAEADSANELLNYARMALPVVILIIGFIFFRLLMRSVTKRSYRVAEGDGEPPAVPVAFALAQVAATRALKAPDIDLGTRSELEIQVQRLATSHPETVAEVVQSWLRED